MGAGAGGGGGGEREKGIPSQTAHDGTLMPDVCAYGRFNDLFDHDFETFVRLVLLILLYRGQQLETQSLR